MLNADLFSRLEKVKHFIETHLDEDLDCDALAAMAFYSKFHFHRLFLTHAGEGVYAFRKRLLLERAVRQLQYGSQAITEIAFNSGYDNQASFNKAFKKQFGFTPSQVRKQLVHIRSEQLVLVENRGVTMKPEIKILESRRLISARGTGSYSDAASEAWGKVMKFAYSNRLMKPQVSMYGISYDDPSITEPNRIRYDAGVDIDATIEGENTDTLKYLDIAAGKYAMFLHKGSYDDLGKTYQSIFQKWLPDSGEQLRDLPCFERYLNRDPRRTKPENLKTEIYVPLQS